jgi:pseudouridine kinase
MADIIVVGGANVDIKAKVAGHHLLGTSNPGVVTTTAGGVGRNIAHNLARLGASVALISAVGDDPYGDVILNATARAGVDVSPVLRQQFATGTYVAQLDGDGEMISAVSDMRILELVTPDVIRGNATKLHKARLVIADCNLPIESLIAIAELAGPKLAIESVSVEKSKKLPRVLHAFPVFLATPNLHQIEALFGNRDIEHAVKRLHQMGLSSVVVHAGSEGAFASDGKDLEHIPAQASGSVMDVTGAGDAALAGMLHGLLLGDDLFQAAARGQATAAQVVKSTRSTLE